MGGLQVAWPLNGPFPSGSALKLVCCGGAEVLVVLGEGEGWV